MTFRKIAIDGPAVSGKSSAARQLAGRLGWLYLDSGAVYRSITLATMKGTSLDREDMESVLDQLSITLEPLEAGRGCKVTMQGKDVSEAIRGQEVSENILPISGNPRVREWVVEFLRYQSKGQHVVMDGRDIASVVFPDADFKFYVTASVEARALRRYKDLKEGETHSLEELAKAIEDRDQGDRQRKVGPLIKVPQAMEVDNSNLGLMETVDIMYRHVMDILEENP